MARATHPDYLRYQYGTTEKLDTRINAHQRYSERTDDYLEWVLDRLDPRPGDLAVDVGCGKGSFHPPLVGRSVRTILGIDASPAMVAATQAQANALGLPVIAIRGSAEALPLPERSYDLALANHVLFLVADQRAALSELRRVLCPSGRVVLTTNAEDHCERLQELHRAAAERLGYHPADRVTARFHLGHLARVQEAFPDAEAFVREDAFLFPSTDAALAYYASGLVDAISDVPPDDSHRPRLEAEIGAAIEVIIQREGVLRVPKNGGCFVATA
jgi:ubiquinone/menaquinone biosynthesis C-methylase UbiE